jgi:para-aminobenzoate synthetase component 1
VQRKIAIFPVYNTEIFKEQMLSWANQFNICCFLDNNRYNTKHHSYEWLLAAGAAAIFSPSKNILESLKYFYATYSDWLFGHVGYDLKNEIEDLYSSNPDNIQFPDIFLFQPQIVIQSNGTSIIISSLQDEAADILNSIHAQPIQPKFQAINIETKPRVSKEEYLNKTEALRQHILRGDCYEINFCMEFFAEDICILPLRVYKKLTAISPNPFSCYYKCSDKYLFCASPERYLKKEGSTIISQPIKGTMRRDKQNEYADETNKKILHQSGKDRSENVMIVDLMRNDLSKVCKDDSVKVEELFGIYTFPQVHQMISTIKGELKKDVDFADILKATFPMGSMTGAPKKRVMELIEQYEKSRRGIFSGAVGYITPEKDFDFNVVIRSIMYNETKKYLGYQVGSGITFYSDAEQEYEECLLKAEAIKQVLH